MAVKNKDDGGDAFPSPGVILRNGNQQGAYSGMTLRDYFAAKAMQSAQSDPAVMIMLGPKPNADKVAEYAYWVADAMLAERAK